MSGRRIVIAAAGEGVGRTATAVNLAVELTHGGWSVMLADLDPEAGATRALGQEPARDPWGEPAAVIELDGGALHLVRGGRALAGATSSDVRRLVEGIPSHDIILVDTPAEVTTIPAAAAEGAELLLVPLRPGPEAVRELRSVAQLLTLVQTEACLLRAVLVRTGEAAPTAAARVELEQAYPGATYDSVVPEHPAITEAMQAGESLARLAPESAAAAAYRMLAIEVMADLDRLATIPEPDR